MAIDPRITGRTRQVIEALEHKNASRGGVQWAVSEPVYREALRQYGDPEIAATLALVPVVPQQVVDALAERFLRTGDKSGMLQVSQTLEDMSRVLGNNGYVSGERVAKANTAFASALAQRVQELKMYSYQPRMRP